jgi:hypothetical protein
VDISVVDGGQRDSELLVFCHDELVQNAIMQLIDNVVTHRDAEHLDRSVTLEINTRIEADEVVLTFRNTGTQVASRPGKGIASAQRKLRDFGGDLRTVDPSAGWSFEARLRFLRWTDIGE